MTDAVLDKILIIDDEPRIRQLIANFLQSRGYATIQAENGLGVIDRITSNHVRLVIMDILMDHQAGLESLTQIRKHFPDLPVIMLSSDSYYLDMSTYLGASAILGKPINLETLNEKVEQLLSSSGI